MGLEDKRSFLGPPGPTAPCCPPTPGHQAPADCLPSRLPPGHGDYAYQQSYTEQTYDRSFEESTQHYYEGGKAAPLGADSVWEQGTPAGALCPASTFGSRTEFSHVGVTGCTCHDTEGPGPHRRQTRAARGR